MSDEIKILLEITNLKSEQKKDKATIEYLKGFVKGLDERISNLENQNK